MKIDTNFVCVYYKVPLSEFVASDYQTLLMAVRKP